MYKKLSILFLSSILLFPLYSHAQRKNSRFISYIDEYSDLAVDHMKRYKIPASIKLAQALLESGAGQSRLSRESNNHFGIKCGRSWNGKTVRATDDLPNECFRAYKKVSESFEDHSKFLATGARYAFLFKLDVTDYKGWARGLKKAGYATSPSYANRLITIIEDYELYKYDSKKKASGKTKEKKDKKGKDEPTFIIPHQVYKSNNLAYVIARRGDTFESLDKEFDINWKKLIKYNDLHEGYTMADGDIIYLCKKKKKADKKYTVHVVKDGDSMHSISQIYGIRLKDLYKMNRKDGEYLPAIGDRLRVR